jgi:hypothetical protein
MSKTTSRRAKGKQNGDTEFFQLPEDLLSIAFRSLGYRKVESEIEISYRLLLPPGDQWTTVVAIDSSESMRRLFGRVLTGDVPLGVQKRYQAQGYVTEEQREGKPIRFYQPEAYEDALAKGYLSWTKNEVEPAARRILEFLAEQVDRRRASNLMYISCAGGYGVRELGEIALAACSAVAVNGPDEDFGNESRLLPSVQYLADTYAGVGKTLVVILTDGHFADIQAIKEFSGVFSRLISMGQKNFMKFSILGIGGEIDPENMAELTDLKTAWSSGLWNYCRGDEPGEFRKILEGIIEENQVLAPGVVILDAAGNVIKVFDTEFPAKGTFKIPGNLTSFFLRSSSEKYTIHQSLLLPFHNTLSI